MKERFFFSTCLVKTVQWDVKLGGSQEYDKLTLELEK